MDRTVLAWTALVVFGLLLVVTAPPDPSYSVSVYGPTDPPSDESVVAFENLSEENRDLFRAALERDQRFAEPPDVETTHVAYEGDTYEMSLAAHEGPLLSLVQPPIGGLFVLAGCLVAAYRHLYRPRYRDG